jgi:hypothetical protein
MAIDTFSAVLATDVLSGLDIYEPEHNARLMRAHSHQGADWFLTLQMIGNEAPVSQEQYYDWEEGYIWDTFKVRANVASPGAGNQIVIVIAAANLTADYKFFPQANDVVLFANQVTGFIVSVDKTTTPSAPALTIVPNNIGSNIGALSAGDEIVVYSNAWGEGAGQPQGRVSKPTMRTGHLTSVRTSLDVSGTEMTNATRVKVLDEAGVNFLGWYGLENQVYLDFRHSGSISRKLLVDELTTNTSKVLDATSTTGSSIAYGTEGLLPAMNARAIPYPKASGALTIDDFLAMDLAITKEYNTGNVIALCGNKRMQNVNKILLAANYSTGIDLTVGTGVVGDAVTDFTTPRGRAMAIGFNSFDTGVRTWHFKNMMEFNDPKALGATGFPYPDIMAVFPTGSTTDAKDRSKMIPYSSVVFKKLGAYSRRMEIWQDGAAGPGPKNGSIDVHHDYMRTSIGARHVCVNKYLLVQAP